MDRFPPQQKIGGEEGQHRHHGDQNQEQTLHVVPLSDRGQEKACQA